MNQKSVFLHFLRAIFTLIDVSHEKCCPRKTPTDFIQWGHEDQGNIKTPLMAIQGQQITVYHMENICLVYDFVPDLVQLRMSWLVLHFPQMSVEIWASNSIILLTNEPTIGNENVTLAVELIMGRKEVSVN